MAQFMRPNTDITATWNTSTGTTHYVLIDEETAVDSDYVVTPDQQNLTDEMGLSGPASTPGSGTCTVRWRETQADGEVVNSSGGNASTLEVQIVADTANTVYTSGAIATTEGAWGDRNGTFDSSAISDWDSVRIHLVATGSGGPGPSRRGVAVSWAELEVPDGAFQAVIPTQFIFT